MYSLFHQKNVYLYDDLYNFVVSFVILNGIISNWYPVKLLLFYYILMTVNYTLYVSKSIIIFVSKEEKIRMPIKSIPKYPLIREISMWIINHDLWIDPLKKITSMNPWPYAIQTSPPFTDNSHLSETRLHLFSL